MNERKPGVTALGAIVSIVLVAGLIGLGVYMLMGRGGESASSPSGDGSASSATAESGSVDVADVQVEVPRLSQPGTVQLSDNIVPIEISEYALTLTASR